MKLHPRAFSFVLFLAVLPFLAQGQTLYQDAKRMEEVMQAIKSIYPDTSSVTFLRYQRELNNLVMYQSGHTSFSNLRAQHDRLKTDSVFRNLEGVLSIRVGPQAATTASSNTLASGFSAPSFQASLIDGLASFLAERFKQELVTAFFEQFRTVMLDSNYIDLQILFPQTFGVFSVSVNTDYESLITTLKAAFEKDLQNMLIHMDDLILKRYPNAGDPEKRVYLLTAVTIGEGIYESRHPIEILDSLNHAAWMSNATPAFQNTVGIMDLLSNILRGSSRNANPWITMAELDSLIIDRQLRGYYMALLKIRYAKELSKLRLSNNSSLLVWINRMEAEYNGAEVDQLLRSFLEAALQIQELINTINQRTAAGQTSWQQYSRYFTALNNLVVQTMKQYYLNDMAAYQKAGFAAKFMPVVNSAQGIFDAALDKNYGLLIVNTVSALNQFLPADYPSKGALMRYGTFMANLATAQNATQVTTAIEAIALPPGSYITKRKTFQNISLNAFAGAYGGGEQLRANLQWKPVMAFTAPIGLAYSWGWRTKMQAKYNANPSFDGGKRVLNGRSGSLFFSIIDLGAVVSYRIDDKNVQPLPELTFQNVLAPGAYFVYGFGKVPISWSIGAQYGPMLRELTQNNATVGSQSWRVGTGVLVDIPLVNLYTKSIKP